MSATKVPRQTPQKALVRDALAAAGDFVSAQALHSIIEASGRAIGLATVYRNLNDLAERGDADVVQTANGSQLFRACGSAQHHHHLVCVNCGKTVEIEAPLEDWVHRVVDDNGFTLERHVVDIFGRCAACQALLAAE